MIKIENECVGCPDGMPCLYESCPYWAVKRFYCDSCDCEEELYWFEDEQLCIDCIIERLEKVEYDE